MGQGARLDADCIVERDGSVTHAEAVLTRRSLCYVWNLRTVSVARRAAVDLITHTSMEASGRLGILACRSYICCSTGILHPAPANPTK